jgi:DNA-binding response OmpR family regulator
MQNKANRVNPEIMRKASLRYLERLKERQDALKKLLARCEKNAFRPEYRDELISHAHQLAGSGATFGFHDLSSLGRSLEDDLVDHPDADVQKLITNAHALIDACTSAVGAVPETAPASGQSKSPNREAQSRSLPQLLVVDDDANIRDLMRELFQQEARVRTAENAKQALELMTKHKPDLVLLDDMLPGSISGLRLLEDIQSLPDIKNIPVVMITASRKPEEVMRGLMAGAADYIIKPFDREKLVTLVRDRIRRQHSAILVADDDAAVRELLEHKFRAAGCKVASAADGAQAWKMLQDQEFALVILDRMMPGFDGMTLLLMMRKTEKLASTPVVFLTARHYGADVLDGLNTGAADYIVKPFDPDEVVARCVRLLDRKEA